MTLSELTKEYLYGIGSCGAIFAAVIAGLNTHLIKNREQRSADAEKQVEKDIQKAHSLNDLTEKMERTQRAFHRLARLDPPLDDSELIDETVAAFSRLSEFISGYKLHRIYLTAPSDELLYQELIQAFVHLNLALNLDIANRREEGYQSQVKDFRDSMDRRVTRLKNRCLELIQKFVSTDT